MIVIHSLARLGGAAERRSAAVTFRRRRLINARLCNTSFPQEGELAEGPFQDSHHSVNANARRKGPSLTASIPVLFCCLLLLFRFVHQVLPPPTYAHTTYPTPSHLPFLASFQSVHPCVHPTHPPTRVHTLLARVGGPQGLNLRSHCLLAPLHRHDMGLTSIYQDLGRLELVRPHDVAELQESPRAEEDAVPVVALRWGKGGGDGLVNRCQSIDRRMDASPRFLADVIWAHPQPHVGDERRERGLLLLPYG